MTQYECTIVWNATGTCAMIQQHRVTPSKNTSHVFQTTWKHMEMYVTQQNTCVMFFMCTCVLKEVTESKKKHALCVAGVSKQ